MSDVGFRLEDGDELLTVDEIAERYGVAVRTIETWRQRYEGAPVPVNAPAGSRRGKHMFRWSEWKAFYEAEPDPG